MMYRRQRILVAGLFHETHSFLAGRTRLGDFSERRGEQMRQARGDGSPLAAVFDWAGITELREIVPAIDLRAHPSATVADEVVDHFWAELRRAVAAEIDRLDGIYLVLHGAMLSESLLDVEGELLERLRGLPGVRQLPITAVLDLHANVSRRMVEHLDGLVAYRQNPHTDGHRASWDALQMLSRLIERGERATTVFEQPPVVWPPTGTGTAEDPMATLETMARQIEREHPEILAVSVFAGFAYADTPDTGVSLTATTVGDPQVAQRELARLSAWAVEHRELGNRLDPSIDEVLPKLQQHERGPIVLVEPSDNVGGGAPGDGTGILRALIAAQIDNAAVVINDPAAVSAVQSLSPGESIRLSIGGKGSTMDAGPLELDVELVSTSDGRFELEDIHSHLASMCGRQVEMGPCAVVRHAGIRILLTTRKTPPFDLGQLRSQGIVPEELYVIGVKAAVAHRRAYDPIAAASYWVDTPGPCCSNLRAFEYQHLRRPVYPLDK